VSKLELGDLSPLILSKDPPPWVPAVTSHTTSAVSESAETHLVRAVNTGIIDASSHLVRSPVKSPLNIFTGRFSRARVRGEAQTAGTGTGGSESETEGGRKGESANVVGVLFLAVASDRVAIVETLTPADPARNRDDTTSQRL